MGKKVKAKTKEEVKETNENCEKCLFFTALTSPAFPGAYHVGNCAHHENVKWHNNYYCPSFSPKGGLFS